MVRQYNNRKKMAPTAYKQDLPPPGGYAKIIYERIPARKLFGSVTLFLGYAVIQTLAILRWNQHKEVLRQRKLELNDAKIALEPFLLAERDRSFLKQIRRNHIEERELMKNVPGWEVGTLYGEPIYKTVPTTEWINPPIDEFYAHADPDYYLDIAFFPVYH